MNERQGKYRRNRANAITIRIGHLGGTSYLFLRCVTKIVWMPQCWGNILYSPNITNSKCNSSNVEFIKRCYESLSSGTCGVQYILINQTLPSHLEIKQGFLTCHIKHVSTKIQLDSFQSQIWTNSVPHSLKHAPPIQSLNITWKTNCNTLENPNLTSSSTFPLLAQK